MKDKERNPRIEVVLEDVKCQASDSHGKDALLFLFFILF